ncbi:MAG: Gfo/Idh/MocA family oxidoreductase, partial [Cyclobacteriaceae bacterium]
MKNNRREFIKLAGMAGAGIVVGPARSQAENPKKQVHRQSFNMHGYAAPKLERVRVGLIGIGSRGSGTLKRLASIENVDIMALCDIIPENVQKALKSIDGYGHDPDTYTDGEDAWKALCDRNDIDLIYTATPWKFHAPIAVYAMEGDKHVYTELPVGITLEECWQVVETSERTKKHCFMGCGSCHDGMSAIVLNMVRDGLFGDLIHGEGNYIHDRVNSPGRWERDEHNWFGFRPWRLKENVGRDGNLYPQHGLGPVAQMMDLNYGDQMDYLVSISSNDFTMAPKMKELAENDAYFEPYDGLKFRGNMNTTLIRTHRGRTIMLQHDISSPTQGSRFQLNSGSKGIYEARPPRIAVSEEYMDESEFKALVEKYTPTMTKKFQEIVSQAGGIIGDRSYERVTASDWRLIDCLRNGLPL